MTGTNVRRRREVLALLGLAVGLAGCAESLTGDSEATASGNSESDPGSGSASGAPTVTNWSPGDYPDWPMSSHDPGNTGHNPNATGVPDDPSVVAQYGSGIVGGLEGEPTIRDGRVYFHTDQNQLFVYDTLANDRVYSHKVVEAGRGPAVVGPDHVFLTADEEIRALPRGDAAPQQRAWSTGFEYTRFGESTGTLLGDTLYVIETGEEPGEPSVHALETGTGEERWSAPDIVSQNDVAVRNGTVVASQHRDSPKAFELETGELRWEADLEAGITAAVAGPDRVYVTGNHVRGNRPFVYALDYGSGEVQWKFRVPFGVVSRPALADGTLFAPDGEGQLFAVDGETGDQQWEAPLGTNPSRPAVADGVVYVGDESGTVHAFDAATGERQWHLDARRGRVLYGPIVVGDRLYVHKTAVGRA